jgi:hypothetical protein
VAASQEDLQRVEELVETLDAPEDIHVRIFRLRYALVDTVVTTMAELVPDVRITVDTRSNSIIVAAPEEAFERVVELIETLDIPPSQDHPQRGEIEIYQLQRIDAAYAAGTMEFLMGPRESSRAADDVRIEADPKNNRLLVYGPPEAHMEVKQLLAKLDGSPDPDHQPRSQVSVYQLHHVEARNAVLSLQSLLGLSESSGVRVDADPKSNRLFLYAPLATHLQVKELLEKLDAPPEPGGDQQVKVFELVQIDAATVAEAVSRLFDAEDVTISVDPTANRVLAKGPEATLEVLEALLLRLDESKAPERDPRASTTYHVRVVWLASGLPEGIGTEPADDLGDVLAELAKVGVTGVRQVGQAMVYTLPDGQFEITASPMLEKGPTQMQIDGKLDQRQATPHLDIRLSARQVTYVPVSPDPRLVRSHPQAKPDSQTGLKIEHKGLIDLETEIAAPLGHYVVLGVTPVGNATSVFVVRVTESDPVRRPPKKADSEDR